MSYTEIALIAYDGGRGRKRLSTMLLDYEPHAANQVTPPPPSPSPPHPHSRSLALSPSQSRPHTLSPSHPRPRPRPHPSAQVKLLLSMNENELALQKAVNSMDSDLVFLVLLNTQGGLGNNQPKRKEEFFHMVYNHPDATALLKVYYRHKLSMGEADGAGGGGVGADGDSGQLLKVSESRTIQPCPAPPSPPQKKHPTHSTPPCGHFTTLRRPHAQMVNWRRDYLEAGTVTVMQSYRRRRLEDRVQGMREASTYFSQNPKLAFQQKAVDEQVELLNLQRDFESKYSEPTFIDMSVSDTVKKLVMLAGARQNDDDAVRPLLKYDRSTRLALLNDANRVGKTFKVPEKRFWHIKVKALAKSHQWEELKKFGGEKKSPIGYGPFAEACIEQRIAPEIVAPYIERIPSTEER